MTRSIFVSLCLFLSLLACSAQLRACPQIHKCIDANGVSSYQTLACADPQQHVWSRQVAAPKPVAATAAGAATAPAPRSQQARAGTGAGHAQAASQPLADDDVVQPASRPARGKRRSLERGQARADHGPRAYAQAAWIPADPQAATPACQSARRRRDETLARVGLKRTYSLLRKLDDGVQRACQ